MAYILIIDDNKERCNYLCQFLTHSGYKTSGTPFADPDHSDYSGYDMVIVNLFPDVPRSWDLFHQLKQKWPDLPLFIYFNISIQVLRQMKEAMGEILTRRHYPLIPVATTV